MIRSYLSLGRNCLSGMFLALTLITSAQATPPTPPATVRIDDRAFEAARAGANVVLPLRIDRLSTGIKGIVRVNHSGCLGQCGHGPMVVVYPDDVWYHGVKPEDAQRLVSEHLQGGRPLEDLRYIAPPGDNKLP